MALLNVVHTPIPGQARQFDGTLDAFLDIINARPKSGLTAACHFDEAGNFVSLRLDGLGESITLNLLDWVIFPSDPTEPVVSMPDAKARAKWAPAAT